MDTDVRRGPAPAPNGLGVGCAKNNTTSRCVSVAETARAFATSPIQDPRTLARADPDARTQARGRISARPSRR